jgi:hypothetical protein
MAAAGLFGGLAVIREAYEQAGAVGLPDLLRSGTETVGDLCMGVMSICGFGGGGLWILLYRNRTVIDSHRRTLSTDSGVPAIRFGASTRPWDGDAYLRLSRVRPYMQTRAGRFTGPFIRRARSLRPNDGTYFYYLVEFCDAADRLRLAQFGFEPVAERFVEKTSKCLGLRWQDDRRRPPA